jgi:hypothetical protein
MSPNESSPTSHWSELESQARAAFSKFEELRGFL